MNGAAFGAFVAAGQTCVSGKRILIHESIYDEFVAKLVAKVDGFALGDPLQVIPAATAPALLPSNLDHSPASFLDQLLTSVSWLRAAHHGDRPSDLGAAARHGRGAGAGGAERGGGGAGRRQATGRAALRWSCRRVLLGES